MQSVSDIKSIKESDGKMQLSFVAVVKSIQARVAKNSSEFLALELGDKSASLAAMCFDSSAAFEILRGARAGDVFELRAVSDFFQGRLSPKIEGARRLSPEEIEREYAALAPVSPFEPNQMRAEFLEIVDSISDAALRETVKFAIDATAGNFFTSTAAVKMHHAYMHGLLEHSLRCARMAATLAPLYPGVDRDLAVAGAAIHDIGKVAEYSQGLAPERTRAGILHGHVVLGYRMVRRAGLKCGLNADILERLEHIVLSHQGEPEWGAAVRAATPEAVFVANIDNFDAKMGAIEAALQPGADEFVEVPALRVKLLSPTPDHTPKPE